MRKALTIGLCLALALYLCWPLLDGQYGGVYNEQNLFRAYLDVFTSTLGRFELPLWNERVGSGYPAILFGQYPFNHTALFYALFGTGQGSYAALRALNLFLLLLGYLYVGKREGYGTVVAALGALTYFSINWCLIWFLTDTVSGLILFLPLTFYLLIKNMETDFRSRRDLLLYYLVFVLWASGGDVAFHFMPAVLLAIAYVLGALFVYPLPARRAAVYFLYLILFPWLAVLGQIYFVYDVIAASNRMQKGILAPITSPQPILEFLRSLAASSYLWISGVIFSVHRLSASKNRGEKAGALALLALLTGLAVSCRWLGIRPAFFTDYVDSLSCGTTWLGLYLFFAWGFFFHREALRESQVRWRLFLIFSLISCLLLSPGNNPSPEGRGGYDYLLFMDYPLAVRASLIAFVLLGALDRERWRFHKLVLLALIALYLCRSHLAILLMRYTGIPWYGVRDGILFGLFFSFLVMAGVTLAAKDLRSAAGRLLPVGGGRKLVAALGVGLVIFYSAAVRRKIYQGSVNQLTRKLDGTSVAMRETSDYARLRDLFSRIQKEDRQFYRVSTPGISPIFLAGGLQDMGFHDAAIYDSTIPRQMDHFFRQVILQIPERAPELRFALPCSLFPKHVHAGFQLAAWKDIPYDWDFLLSHGETAYLRKENLAFWWEMSQAKYLLLGRPELFEGLQMEEDPRYERLASFDDGAMRVYRMRRERPASRWGVLRLRPGESVARILRRSNSDDLQVMKEVYRRVMPIGSPGDAGIVFSETRPQNGLISAQIDTPEDAILIDFESWDANWRLETNGRPQPLAHAFQIFRALEIKKGRATVLLEYRQPVVRLLLVAGALLFLLNVLALALPRERARSRAPAPPGLVPVYQ